MDFHGMKRKELQTLCKKHGVPANLTNREMADRLASIFQENLEVVVLEDSSSNSEDIGGESEAKVVKKPAKKVRFSPENQTFEYEVSVYGRPTRRSRKKFLSKSPAQVIENSPTSQDVAKFEGRQVRVTRSRAQKTVEDAVNISPSVGRKRRRGGMKNRDAEANDIGKSEVLEMGEREDVKNGDDKVDGGLNGRQLRSRKIVTQQESKLRKGKGGDEVHLFDEISEKSDAGCEDSKSKNIRKQPKRNARKEHQSVILSSEAEMVEVVSRVTRQSRASTETSEVKTVGVQGVREEVLPLKEPRKGRGKNALRQNDVPQRVSAESNVIAVGGAAAEKPLRRSRRNAEKICDGIATSITSGTQVRKVQEQSERDIAVEEPPKCLRGYSYRRKSVVAQSGKGENNEESLKKETNKRNRITELDAIVEHSDEVEKAKCVFTSQDQVPLGRSRCKTVILNPPALTDADLKNKEDADKMQQLRAPYIVKDMTEEFPRNSSQRVVAIKGQGKKQQMQEPTLEEEKTSLVEHHPATEKPQRRSNCGASDTAKRVISDQERSEDYPGNADFIHESFLIYEENTGVVKSNEEIMIHDGTSKGEKKHQSRLSLNIADSTDYSNLVEPRMVDFESNGIKIVSPEIISVVNVFPSASQADLSGKTSSHIELEKVFDSGEPYENMNSINYNIDTERSKTPIEDDQTKVQLKDANMTAADSIGEVIFNDLLNELGESIGLKRGTEIPLKKSEKLSATEFPDGEGIAFAESSIKATEKHEYSAHIDTVTAITGTPNNSKMKWSSSSGTATSKALFGSETQCKEKELYPEVMEDEINDVRGTEISDECEVTREERDGHHINTGGFSDLTDDSLEKRIKGDLEKIAEAKSNECEASVNTETIMDSSLAMNQPLYFDESKSCDLETEEPHEKELHPQVMEDNFNDVSGTEISDECEVTREERDGHQINTGGFSDVTDDSLEKRIKGDLEKIAEPKSNEFEASVNTESIIDSSLAMNQPLYLDESKSCDLETEEPHEKELHPHVMDDDINDVRGTEISDVCEVTREERDGHQVNTGGFSSNDSLEKWIKGDQEKIAEAKSNECEASVKTETIMDSSLTMNQPLYLDESNSCDLEIEKPHEKELYPQVMEDDINDVRGTEISNECEVTREERDGHQINTRGFSDVTDDSLEKRIKGDLEKIAEQKSNECEGSVNTESIIDSSLAMDQTLYLDQCKSCDLETEEPNEKELHPHVMEDDINDVRGTEISDECEVTREERDGHQINTGGFSSDDSLEKWIKGDLEKIAEAKSNESEASVKTETVMDNSLTMNQPLYLDESNSCDRETEEPHEKELHPQVMEDDINDVRGTEISVECEVTREERDGHQINTGGFSDVTDDSLEKRINGDQDKIAEAKPNECEASVMMETIMDSSLTMNQPLYLDESKSCDQETEEPHEKELHPQVMEDHINDVRGTEISDECEVTREGSDGQKINTGGFRYLNDDSLEKRIMGDLENIAVAKSNECEASVKTESIMDSSMALNQPLYLVESKSCDLETEEPHEKELHPQVMEDHINDVRGTEISDECEVTREERDGQQINTVGFRDLKDDSLEKRIKGDLEKIAEAKSNECEAFIKTETIMDSSLTMNLPLYLDESKSCNLETEEPHEKELHPHVMEFDINDVRGTEISNECEVTMEKRDGHHINTGGFNDITDDSLEKGIKGDLEKIAEVKSNECEASVKTETIMDSSLAINQPLYLNEIRSSDLETEEPHEKEELHPQVMEDINDVWGTAISVDCKDTREEKDGYQINTGCFSDETNGSLEERGKGDLEEIAKTKSNQCDVVEGEEAFRSELLSPQKKNVTARKERSNSVSVKRLTSSILKSKSKFSMVQRTPKRLIIHDMKENEPSTKRERIGHRTMPKTSSKRTPLEPVWKY